MKAIPPAEWTGDRERVLRLLHTAAGPLWPLAVARETGIKYATVYSTLRTLYDLGWVVGITETEHPKRNARVLYRLTNRGRAETNTIYAATTEGGTPP